MGSTASETALYNRTISLIFHISGVTNNWLKYLLVKELDNEPALRNQLFCILVCGLMDAADEYLSRINGLKVEAQKIGSKACLYYLDIFSEHIAYVVDLLAIFSRDDMIVISSARDEFVHGHLHEIHKATRSVRFIDGGKFKRERIDSAIYNRVIRELVEQARLSESLHILRARFCAYKTLFWILDRSLSNPNRIALIERDLAQHSRFVGSSILGDFPKLSDKAKHVSHPKYLSLNQIAKNFYVDSPSPDPVAPSRVH